MRSKLNVSLHTNHSKLGELWALFRSEKEHIHIESIGRHSMEDPSAQTEYAGEHGFIQAWPRVAVDAYCLEAIIHAQRMRRKRASPTNANTARPRDIPRRVLSEREGMAKEIRREDGERKIALVHLFSFGVGFL
jgi:hypothetical protein